MVIIRNWIKYLSSAVLSLSRTCHILILSFFILFIRIRIYFTLHRCDDRPVIFRGCQFDRIDYNENVCTGVSWVSFAFTHLRVYSSSQRCRGNETKWQNTMELLLRSAAHFNLNSIHYKLTSSIPKEFLGSKWQCVRFDLYFFFFTFDQIRWWIILQLGFLAKFLHRPASKRTKPNWKMVAGNKRISDCCRE